MKECTSTAGVHKYCRSTQVLQEYTSTAFYLYLGLVERKPVKTVLSSHSKRRQKLVFKTNYCLMQVKSIAECSKGSMLQGEHSAILSTFIKLPYVIKIFVLSICEWQLKTGFTVFGMSHQVIPKLACSVKETSKKIKISLVASFKYDTFHRAKYTGPDKTARMCGIVCAFVRKHQRQVFSH